MKSESETIINSLHQNWIWLPNWQDSSPKPTAGHLVKFRRSFHLSSIPSKAIVHCTADTRYKLFINSHRVNLGPARSNPERWIYDTLDISPYLQVGENEVIFIVMRYFLGLKVGFPFVRTAFPGLTVSSKIGEMDISTQYTQDWEVGLVSDILFPPVLKDDWCLHISERTDKDAATFEWVKPERRIIKLLNGDLAPWRLHPRDIPLPEQTNVKINTIRACQSTSTETAWHDLLDQKSSLSLPSNSQHTLDLQADCHSTAFVTLKFKAASPTRVKIKMIYSEGYELEPRDYPFFRTKNDRLDAEHGYILGTFDEVTINVGPDGTSYEPFWFRTFRLIRLELTIGDAEVEMISMEASQTNYPMQVKASWDDPSDEHAGKILDISVRTLRNCMFDGYSDCPYYEQLSYSGDSRSVSLFHYLLSGDDRLARENITSFAGSITPEGLTQSRFPSHGKQLIAGFPLYWILQICDHMLYFGDVAFTKSLLPRIDGVLEFFDRHVDELGLISGLPSEIWQYCDWVEGWHATHQHPDKGVPTAGRLSNRHTYFSMLYAYVLKQAAVLVRRAGRPQYAEEYETRAEKMIQAIRKHCFDEKLGIFTDSTSDVPPDTPTPYSQHAQVFAVLSGACPPCEAPSLLLKSFDPSSNLHLGKCSYVMMFYAFRAFATVEGVYEKLLETAMKPWYRMIRQNMTTWEEDDVRQRSDCHAWGSVPVYEYLCEIAGVHPTSKGCGDILFRPRVSMRDEYRATVALGRNRAEVSWKREGDVIKVLLELDEEVGVASQLPNGKKTEHGCVRHIDLEYQYDSKS